MELVNLKTGTDTYQDEDGKTQTRDDYPWGLCIELNNETLTKLKATPQSAGTEVMITAKAIIRSTSTRETEDGMQHNASLQITDMAIGAASGEQTKTAAETLYGNGGE
ncbi:capsid staple protein [Citrobacter braakii]